MNDHSPNDAFHASSFLQGHNAAYVDQLYARYARDPASVDDSWRRYFASLNENADQVQAEAAGPSWARADWPPQPGGELTSALTGEWPAELEKSPKELSDKIQGTAAAQKVEVSEASGARPPLLRLRRGRHGPAHLPRPGDGLRNRLDAGDRGAGHAHLLRHLRAAVHAHLQRRGSRLAEGADRGLRQGDPVHQAGPPRHPQQAGGVRGLREVPARQIHRHQALRPRRRRGDDPGDGADHQARRRPGRAGDRRGHAPSRPPQRARLRHGQALPRHLQRVPGRLLQARGGRRLRRREVPSRRVLGPRVRRQHRAPPIPRTWRR